MKNKKLTIIIIIFILIGITGVGTYYYLSNDEQIIPTKKEEKEKPEQIALKLLVNATGLLTSDFEYIGKTWDEKHEFKLIDKENIETEKYYIVDLEDESYTKEERIKQDENDEKVEITDEDIAGTEYVDITGTDAEEILEKDSDA